MCVCKWSETRTYWRLDMRVYVNEARVTSFTHTRMSNRQSVCVSLHLHTHISNRQYARVSLHLHKHTYLTVTLHIFHFIYTHTHISNRQYARVSLHLHKHTYLTVNLLACYFIYTHIYNWTSLCTRTKMKWQASRLTVRYVCLCK
jgi:hypothetical protein